MIYTPFHSYQIQEVAAPLKFRNTYVIPSHTLLGMDVTLLDYLFILGFKLIRVSKWGLWINV